MNAPRSNVSAHEAPTHKARPGRVSCPLCPRTMLGEDYPRHFELFHRVDLVTQKRNEWREPKAVNSKTRAEAETDGYVPLYD